MTNSSTIGQSISEVVRINFRSRLPSQFMSASGTASATDLGPLDPTVEHADVVSQGNLQRASRYAVRSAERQDKFI